MRGIIFTGDSVIKIIAGQKTQTRRIVKPQPDDSGAGGGNARYRAGEELYVKESFCHLDEEYKHLNRPPGTVIGYRADKSVQVWDVICAKMDPSRVNWNEVKWRPPLHMPAYASRVWIRITKVRRERLHSISVKDAVAEGVESRRGSYRNYLSEPYDEPRYPYLARTSFESLWVLLHGLKSWNSNPWVDVYEFEVVE